MNFERFGPVKRQIEQGRKKQIEIEIPGREREIDTTRAK